MDKLEQRKYPIGKFEYGKTYTINDTKKNIKIIARLPKALKKLLKKAHRADLDTPYREGGWTVRQVIHHLSDSHVNAYIRMKMAVTEKSPTIKPYDEQAWAELETGKIAPVRDSVRLLKVLHKKWLDFMESLSDADLNKGYVHPAMQRTVLLPEAIALYAWHSQHHLAHIRLVVSPKAEDKKVPLVVKLEKVTPPVEKAPEVKTPEATPEAKPTKTTRQPRTSASAAAKAATEKTPAAKTPRRPKSTAPATKAPKLTREEAIEKARAALEQKVNADAPQLTRSEVLAKVRAVKAAEKPADAPTDADTPKLTRNEVLAKARAVKAAKKPADAPTNAADAPKLTRNEALAKARAVKAAQKPATTPADAADAPKLTRNEALAKARAAKAAKKVQDTPE